MSRSLCAVSFPPVLLRARFPAFMGLVRCQCRVWRRGVSFLSSNWIQSPVQLRRFLLFSSFYSCGAFRSVEARLSQATVRDSEVGVGNGFIMKFDASGFGVPGWGAKFVQVGSSWPRSHVSCFVSLCRLVRFSLRVDSVRVRSHRLR